MFRLKYIFYYLSLFALAFIFSFCQIKGGNKKMNYQENQNLKKIKEKINSSLRWEKKNNEFIAATFIDFNENHDQSIMIFKNEKLMFSIDEGVVQVADYCWIPNENKLVYLISDKYQLPAGLNPRATHIGIFHADSLKNKILINVSKMKDNYFLHDANVANYNNKVYVKNASKNNPIKVYELNIKNAELLPTDYKGLNFSPDGTYYTNFVHTGEPLILYKRTTNEVIWDGSKVDDPRLRFQDFLSWHVQNGSYFLYLRNSLGVAKIECKKGILMKFIKKPETGLKPVLENGEIRWK